MSIIRIETLGCRLNQIESESIAHFFSEKAFSVRMDSVTAGEAADSETLLCIVNTCAVTLKAEQKARRIIRLLLKKHPRALIVVTGCYAQLSASEIEKLDERIVVVGGQIKSRLTELPGLLKACADDDNETEGAGSRIKALKNGVISLVKAKPVVKKDIAEDSFKLSTSSFIAHSRASLKIQDGCNNNCSFCAIHLARGKSVSIDVQTAIDRVVELERAGHSEVVLTSVNIAQYRGKYGDGYCNFTQLLKLLLEKTKTISFRISSIYPEIIDDDFCAVISEKRVRPSFHISVQSGSDKILELMNRHYKACEVLAAVEKLKSAKPSSFISCDIITGFPAETDEDFEQTLDLCRKCNFTWIHAFPFSERPGTAACSIKPKVPQSVSGNRAKKITELAIKNKIEYIETFVGKELELVLEPPEQKSAVSEQTLWQSGKYHGMTENFIHCELEQSEELEQAGTLEQSTETVAVKARTVKVMITEVLKDRITKGGDIEAKARIVK